MNYVNYYESVFLLFSDILLAYSSTALELNVEVLVLF